MSAGIPQDVARTLTASLRHAISGDESVARRLVEARTSVEFRVEGRAASVTLVLDTFPPEVLESSQPADVVILLTERQTGLFEQGALVLPNELSSGAVRFSGPVRHFLAVEPIIRRRLADMA